MEGKLEGWRRKTQIKVGRFYRIGLEKFEGKNIENKVFGEKRTDISRDGSQGQN